MTDYSVSVMYCAGLEGRKETVEKLQKEFPDIYVSNDIEKQGTWFNARRCLEYSLEQNKEYSVIFQDDIDFSLDLKNTIPALYNAQKQAILICMCSVRGKTKTAYEKGYSWATAYGILGGFYGLIIKTSYIRIFLNWVDNLKETDKKIHDDVYLKYWSCLSKILTYIPIPNLVQHKNQNTYFNHPLHFKRYSKVAFNPQISYKDHNWSKKDCFYLGNFFDKKDQEYYNKFMKGSNG